MRSGIPARVRSGMLARVGSRMPVHIGAGTGARMRIGKKAAAVILVVGVAAGIFFPIYWMFLSSINDPLSYPPNLFLDRLDFGEYTGALHDPQVLQWLKNTFVVAVGTVVANLICSTLAAYAIARLRFWGKGAVLLLVLSTQMMSQALLVAPMYSIFTRIGIINTLGCLILADVALTLPLSTWILMRFFERIPRELEEAGLIDGCTPFGVFHSIILPLSTPGLVTVAVLTFFDTWNEYVFAYTFVSDQTRWVASVGLSSFIGQFLISWRSIMARTLIFTLLPILFYLLLERYVVSGIVEGALKE